MKSLWLLLMSRTFMFALFQAIIPLFLNSWTASIKYWMLSATLTNVVSVVILVGLFRKEGTNYLSIFRFKRNSWHRDLLLFLGLAILSILIVLVPALFLESWLWGNTGYYQDTLFQPVSTYMACFLLLVFPVSIGFAELPTYFGYIMPRLEAHLPSKILVVLLPIIFLSIQHCTLPLVLRKIHSLSRSDLSTICNASGNFVVQTSFPSTSFRVFTRAIRWFSRFNASVQHTLKSMKNLPMSMNRLEQWKRRKLGYQPKKY